VVEQYLAKLLHYALSLTGIQFRFDGLSFARLVFNSPTQRKVVF